MIPSRASPAVAALLAGATFLSACRDGDLTGPEEEPPVTPPEATIDVEGAWLTATLVRVPLGTSAYDAVIVDSLRIVQQGTRIHTADGMGFAQRGIITLFRGPGRLQLEAAVDAAVERASGRWWQGTTGFPEDFALPHQPWRAIWLLREGLPSVAADLSGTWSTPAGEQVVVSHDPGTSTVVIGDIWVARATETAIDDRGFFIGTGSHDEFGPLQLYWVLGSVQNEDRINLLVCYQLLRFHADCRFDVLLREEAEGG